MASRRWDRRSSPGVSLRLGTFDVLDDCGTTTPLYPVRSLHMWRLENWSWEGFRPTLRLLCSACKAAPVVWRWSRLQFALNPFRIKLRTCDNWHQIKDRVHVHPAHAHSGSFTHIVQISYASSSSAPWAGTFAFLVKENNLICRETNKKKRCSCDNTSSSLLSSSSSF